MKLEKNIIHMFTDGSSTIAKGIAGVGVVLHFNGIEKQYSKSIGNKTNNVAELSAVKIGLEKCKKKSIPIKIYTDSQYTIGVLSMNWKPKKNIELISEIKKLIISFKSIKFVKVKGHSGHFMNEIVDNLAKEGSYRSD